ncbi:uncharacterized protein LOC62_05G007050 [Vanrija pseudolonga]|uniref:Uncharacterized protein n=1 Tax=Vanrija pseudolonga TaxID=143232 RepID=A0AAF1BNT6_9TREE|nr:hypothetical protein LOC62_05G007050 [Vanrija pseudolonga]
MGACLSRPFVRRAHTHRAARTPTPVPAIALQSVPPALDADSPSNTPPRPDPTLDLLCLPHVLDAIVASASHATLLALRATCTEVKDAINPVLFAHVVIGCAAADSTDPGGDSLPSVLRSRNGDPLPCFVPELVPPPVLPMTANIWATPPRRRSRLLACCSRDAAVAFSDDAGDTSDTSDEPETKPVLPAAPQPAGPQLAAHTRRVDIFQLVPAALDVVRRHVHADVVRVHRDSRRCCPLVHVDFAHTLVYREDTARAIGTVTFGERTERVVHYVHLGGTSFAVLAIRPMWQYGGFDPDRPRWSYAGVMYPYYNTVPRIEAPAAREEVFVFDEAINGIRQVRAWNHITSQIAKRLALDSKCIVVDFEVARFRLPATAFLEDIADAFYTQATRPDPYENPSSEPVEAITLELCSEIVHAWAIFQTRAEWEATLSSAEVEMLSAPGDVHGPANQ